MAAGDIKTSLLSVYDKTGIEEFGQGLHELGINIYASGGTAQRLEDAELPVINASVITGGEAILGHRVVTLSREIFAGILASDSAKDTKELERLDIPRIDLVCVDMYPLQDEVRSKDATLDSVREKTDIGGPSLLRAAAKAGRVVLSKAEQRPIVLEWLREGCPDEDHVRRILAATAESVVATYVEASAKYLKHNAFRRDEILRIPGNSYVRQLVQVAT